MQSATELVHVGFGNVVSVNRIIAIISPGSAPAKRLIQEAKTQSVVMDLTSGRRTKAVVVMDSGHIVLAAITPETIAGRLGTRRRSDLRVVNLDEEETGEL